MATKIKRRRDSRPTPHRPSSLPAGLQQALDHHRSGNIAVAITSYRELLNHRPDDPGLLHLLGLAMAQGGRTEEGIEVVRRAVRLRPDAADFRANLAAVAGGLGRHDEAACEMEQVIKLQPDNVHALNNLGAALEHLGRLDESLAVLRRAVEKQPGFAEAWANLANVLRRSGRADEALDAARGSVALNSNLAQGWFALGAALGEQGRAELLDEQVHCYRRAIELQRDLAGAHVSLGLCLLSRGKWDEGWREYEWRRGEDCRVARSRAGAVSAPFCNLQLNCPIANPKSEIANAQPSAPSGQPWSLTTSTGRPAIDLAGRSILLTGEGGMGNVIQFIRYVPIVAQWAKSVTVTCHAPLVTLLKRVKGIDRVVAHEDEPPTCDLSCPLMSLPAMLGPVLPDVPASVPYIEIETELVERWRAVIAEASCGTAEGGRATPITAEGGRATILRVGVCWRGSQAVAAMRDRSIPAECLKPLASEGVALINLQHGVDPPDEPAMITLPGLGPHAMELLDVVAVIRNLDLVITCDTSIAHLAGALGIETWVALKHNADWRWMHDRADSRWYPTMRLFRQRRAGEWGEVMERMAAALRERVDAVGRQADETAGPSRTLRLQTTGRELNELDSRRERLARETTGWPNPPAQVSRVRWIDCLGKSSDQTAPGALMARMEGATGAEVAGSGSSCSRLWASVSVGA